MKIDISDQNPLFQQGFALGILWRQIIENPDDEITATIHTQDIELVMRMADADGRQFYGENIDEDHVNVVLKPLAKDLSARVERL